MDEQTAAMRALGGHLGQAFNEGRCDEYRVYRVGRAECCFEVWAGNERVRKRFDLLPLALARGDVTGQMVRDATGELQALTSPRKPRLPG